MRDVSLPAIGVIANVLQVLVVMVFAGAAIVAT